MCGICGFIDFQQRSDTGILRKMVASLHHRGPNDNGCEMFFFDDLSVGLGHSRLSIIDLSDAGHQPMSYKNLVITYNGEIYNYKEVKKELVNLGHGFISGSDTEVILHAFEEWGISCISKFIGMFAFVILDKENLDITIVRDRAGVKPLYYYWDEKIFLFTSELKAFYEYPSFKKSINVNSVHQYFDYGYIPAPNCIFENCHKLESGHLLKFTLRKRKIEIKKYWDVKSFYSLPGIDISYDEAINELEKLFLSAFNYRMVSDVPVGIFLSGGYDSTAVTAILQNSNMQKLKTFTVGFDEGVNEAPYAKQIAQYFGTDHEEFYCTTKEAQEIIPSLPYYFDEPYADNSAIPTILVSQLAKKSVTVALSADGGDEIFAGYNHYDTLFNNLKLISKIPHHSRKLISRISKVASTLFNNGFLNYKLAVLASVLKINDDKIPQYLLNSYYSLNQKIKSNLFIQDSFINNSIYEDDYSSLDEVLSIALATDYKMYLPDDVLVKVDRATMSVSLEGREPFLDHRIIEFVAQLPGEYKLGHTKKRILKDIVHKYIPSGLMARPKLGFDVPLKSWLQTDLMYLVEDCLGATAIAKMDVFNVPYVQRLKHDFLRGKLEDYEIVWKLIQFQKWYELWIR
ncbi:asparagine synthase (glutamine-hydrolyzing) [Marinilabiliaceae bacterium JC017]|nr:asparagine synthase (glutamine-hydrolyzing) [Marinilabiliaceae bacterium JC017]